MDGQLNTHFSKQNWQNLTSFQWFNFMKIIVRNYFSSSETMMNVWLVHNIKTEKSFLQIRNTLVILEIILDEVISMLRVLDKESHEPPLYLQISKIYSITITPHIPTLIWCYFICWNSESIPASSASAVGRSGNCIRSWTAKGGDEYDPYVDPCYRDSYQ